MLTIRFVSPEYDIASALRKFFAGCTDVEIIQGTYPDVTADAEFISYSLASNVGVHVDECEAKVVPWTTLGQHRDVPFVVVGGVLPRAVDPFSSEASRITFDAILRELRTYNEAHESIITSIRTLANWLVTSGENLNESCMLLRQVYDKHQ